MPNTVLSEISHMYLKKTMSRKTYRGESGWKKYELSRVSAFSGYILFHAP